MLRVSLILPILAALVLRARGSCFGRDASWKTGGKPVVTQPSRNDPSKVMVDWTSIVNNERCVDKYVVWMWPDGTQKADRTTVKIDVAKNLKSKIMDVQACVGYRFMLELDENEMTGNKKMTGDTLFKTTALPTVTGRLDASSFTVGYHWDPVRQVSDLRMASISFPRELVQHPSCLDYIQVTGSAVRPRRPSLSRSASTSSMTGRVSWTHLPGSPGSREGDSGIRGMFGRGTSSSSSSSRAGSSSPVSSPSLFSYTSPFGPVEPPHYANSLPRSTGGAAHQAGPVKVQPPFLNPMIEILVASKDCAEYNFEIKLMAPRSQEVKKVTNIHLSSLADLPYYVPPPVTDVMTISFGSSGKPVYGVKTSSGVSAACLPAYFEAVDAYRQRLENEIGHMGGRGGQGGQGGHISRGGQGGQGGSPSGQGGHTSGRPSAGQANEASEEEALKKAGCMCTSPHLEFSTTDAALRAKTPDLFGHFHYAGLEGGKPYYQRFPHSHAGSHSHSSHGHTSSSGSIPSSHSPSSSSSPAKPVYLYFHAAKKQWLVGTTKGSTSGVFFSSTENSLAVCPGDPQSVEQWQRKSSFLGRWKKDATLSMTCELDL